jgi:hypothetical protein
MEANEMADIPFVAKLREGLIDAAHRESKAGAVRRLRLGSRQAAIVTALAIVVVGLGLPLYWLAALKSGPQEQVAQGFGAKTGVTEWTLQPGTAVTAGSDTPHLPSATFDLEPGIQGITSASNSIWVVGYASVTRMDEGTGQTQATVDLSSDDGSQVVGAGGDIWVSDGVETLTQIDPQTNQVVDSTDLHDGIVGMASMGDSLWVSVASGSLLRLDPTSGSQLQVFDVGKAGALSIADGGLWITGNSIASRVDTATGQVIAEVNGAEAPIVGAGALLWSVSRPASGNDAENTVIGFDPSTGATVATYNLPRAFELASSSNGELWVFSLPGSTSEQTYLPDPNQPAKVFLIDPVGQQVIGQSEVDVAPAKVAAAGDNLWIAHFDSGRVTKVSAS